MEFIQRASKVDSFQISLIDNTKRATMASLKAEKSVGCQSSCGQDKKEPAQPKASGTATKTQLSTNQATKKAEQKPRETKKKASGGKAGAKN